MLVLLSIVLSFPTVVFTALLCVTTAYWLFVVVGGLSVNVLGEGAADGLTSDGVGGGSVEGAAKGALEGVAKGALEGVAKGALEGSIDALDLGGQHAECSIDVDHEAGHGAAGHAHHGGLSSLLNALKLRSAPATVVLSLIVAFSWLISTLVMQSVPPSSPLVQLSIRAAVLVASPVVALLPTSLLVRPLGRLFTPHEGTTRRDLVGKLCRVRTGSVTDRFGEAIVEAGGAELVVRVRVSPNESLKRGERAIIIDFDDERDAFVIAPLKDVLGERA